MHHLRWHRCLFILVCSFTWFLRRALASTTYQTRVVGGHVERNRDIIEWQVLILRNGKVHCGGTLLKHNKVLTAAHCDVDQSLTSHKLVIGHAKFKHAKRYNIVRVYVHPRYHHGSRGEPINDIAVLEFENKNRNIVSNYPTLNRNHTTPKHGQKVLVSGFGQTTPQLGRTSDVLRTVSLRVVSNLTCASLYHIHMKHRICATGGTRADSCLGDSGGALYVINGNTVSHRSFTTVGITSFGIGCAEPRWPSVFVRVSDYISWIDDVLALKDTRVCPILDLSGSFLPGIVISITNSCPYRYCHTQCFTHHRCFSSRLCDG